MELDFGDVQKQVNNFLKNNQKQFQAFKDIAKKIENDKKLHSKFIITNAKFKKGILHLNIPGYELFFEYKQNINDLRSMIEVFVANGDDKNTSVCSFKFSGERIICDKNDTDNFEPNNIDKIINYVIYSLINKNKQ